MLAARMKLWEGRLYHLWWPQRKGQRDETRQQLAVPKSLRTEILRMQHDEILAGHLGFNKTYERMRERYWWPNMWTEVKEYVLSCPECQQQKASRHKPYGLLAPITGVSRPFEKVACDVVGPLPRSNSGNRYLLTFTDYMTRWPEAFALEETSTETIAKVFVEQVICRHGAPEQFLTDNGSNFCAELMVEVNKLLQISPQHSTPYHPQCNGLVEKFNGTLSKMLSMYVNEHPKDWDVFLPYVLFAYRTSVQASTGETPFFLMHGRDPAHPYDLMYGAVPESEAPSTVQRFRSELTDRIVEGMERARAALEATHKKQKRHYDARHSPATFGTGDLVLLRAQEPKNKFAKRWIGPFRIVRMVGELSAQLQAMHNPRVKRKAHVSQLRRYRQSPSMEIVNPEREKSESIVEKGVRPDSTSHREGALAKDNEEYEVEAIKEERMLPRHQYLVKWAGWSERHNEWVDVSEVNAPEAIATFKRLRKGKQPSTRHEAAKT